MCVRWTLRGLRPETLGSPCLQFLHCQQLLCHQGPNQIPPCHAHCRCHHQCYYFGAMTSWLHHPGQAQGPHGEVIGSSWEESAPTLGAPRNQGCPSASSSHRSAKHREEGASRWGRWEAAEGRRGVMGYWGPDGHWSLSPCPCSSAQARAVSASTGAWKTCGLLENHGRSQAHHQALYFSLWQGGTIPPRTFCCPCLPLRPLQPTVALYSIGSIPEECHY